MIDTKLKFHALAITCGLVLAIAPAFASAQLGGVVEGAKQGVQKGAQGVQKGVETGVDKTKEGADATKKAITGEDNNNPSDNQNRMKPQESQSNTSTTTTESESSRTEQSGTQQKQMPRTAGELPLLALAGCFALSAAGVVRVIRRKQSSRIF